MNSKMSLGEAFRHFNTIIPDETTIARVFQLHNLAMIKKKDVKKAFRTLALLVHKDNQAYRDRKQAHRATRILSRAMEIVNAEI